jgi:DNA-binding response OmpR family regulator
MKSHTLHSHDLTLDVQRGLAQLRGRRLKLSPKEFTLLADLMQHRGQVRKRESLLSYVWDGTQGDRTASLDVHIHTLRSKIEENPRLPQRIQTIYGVGYRFIR